MKKYRVEVPAPKSKRMASNATLIVTLHSQAGDTQLTTKLKQLGTVEFEVPHGFAWLYSTKSLDEETFLVVVQFTNDKLTRSEVVKLVPDKVITNE